MEYSLNHIWDPGTIQGICLNQGVLGALVFSNSGQEAGTGGDGALAAKSMFFFTKKNLSFPVPKPKNLNPERAPLDSKLLRLLDVRLKVWEIWGILKILHGPGTLYLGN